MECKEVVGVCHPINKTRRLCDAMCEGQEAIQNEELARRQAGSGMSITLNRRMLRIMCPVSKLSPCIKASADD